MSKQTEEKRETRAEFNVWYGSWLRECREEINKTIEEVAVATGVGAAVLRDIEAGRRIELYDLVPLWEYYGIGDDIEE